MVVTESTCFLCHFKGMVHGRTENPLAGCPSCHEAPSASIQVGGVTFSHDEFIGKRHVPCQNCHLDAISGDGRAPKERCTMCHNDPAKLVIPADLDSLHDNHVTIHDVECSRCHEEIVHAVRTTLAPLEYGCDVCHEGKHKAQKQMFMGTGGKDFPAVPSHMFETQLDCTACHTEPLVSAEKAGLSGQTFTASQKACVKCHGQAYSGLVSTWKNAFAKMTGELEPKLAAVTAAARKSPAVRAQTAYADSLLSDARYNLEFVKVGRGVHNVFYAAGLLRTANRNLDGAMKSLGEKPLLLSKHSYVGGDYCAVLCHASVGVKMPETVQAFGKTLPHRKHFYQYDVSCTECHSAESHKEISLTPQGCGQCHHGPRNVACEKCHSTQARLYDGTFGATLSVETQPSLMYGSVDCKGCHTEVTAGKASEVVAKACNTCHETGYAEMAGEWLKEMSDLSKKTTDRLASVRASLQKSGKEKSLSQAQREALRRASYIAETLTPRRAVHNPALSEMLFTRALEDLSELENLGRGQSQAP
jgi:hypothetical protein